MLSQSLNAHFHSSHAFIILEPQNPSIPFNIKFVHRLISGLSNYGMVGRARHKLRTKDRIICDSPQYISLAKKRADLSTKCQHKTLTR